MERVGKKRKEGWGGEGGGPLKCMFLTKVGILVSSMGSPSAAPGDAEWKSTSRDAQSVGGREVTCAPGQKADFWSAAGMGKEKAAAEPDPDLQYPLLLSLLEVFRPQTFLSKTDYKDF